VSIGGDRNQTARVREKNNRAYHSLADPAVFPSPTTTHRSGTEIAGKKVAGKPVFAAILDFRDGAAGSERLSDRRIAVPRCKLAARYSGACASARM
jgi:hypothetical protein